MVLSSVLVEFWFESGFNAINFIAINCSVVCCLLCGTVQQICF